MSPAREDAPGEHGGPTAIHSLADLLNGPKPAGSDNPDSPILDDAPPYDPSADVEGAEPFRTLWERLRFALSLQGVTADLGIADTGQLRSGDLEGPTPGLVHRTDGLGLLYPGRLHFLVGEPETFKTWVALQGSLDL